VGDGQDIVDDYSTGSDNRYADTIVFGSDIAKENLWFCRDGNNLVINLVGNNDSVTVNGWFASSYNHIEEIQLTDGSILYDTQVQQLVDAMAAFAPPVGAGAVVSQEAQDQLSPVLAATWQTTTAA
jgi:hypothetical protein